jgi:hypothetical protein
LKFLILNQNVKEACRGLNQLSWQESYSASSKHRCSVQITLLLAAAYAGRNICLNSIFLKQSFLYIVVLLLSSQNFKPNSVLSIDQSER